jgi:dienelactone hydrolase
MRNIIGGLIMAAIMATTAHGEIRTERIEYRHGGTLLEGYLAYDDAIKGKRPGVVVVHEWWGLNDYARHRAEQLAGLGYAAFAIDIYGKGKVTGNPKQAGEWASAFRNDRRLCRERAAAGLDVLRKRSLVDPARIAAIGYCFGGTVVLEMARGGADLKGVVSFHGGLATPNPDDARNIKGKVLVLHGADDTFESPAEIAGFQDEMRRAGVDWQMVYYGGAVHAFTNPDADKAGITGVAYNEAADRSSWQAMRLFLDEIFR